MRRVGIKLSSSGDTIVEVLLALAVIGAVLGGAYVTANRNTQTNIGSQERLTAIKLGESQLERLKATVETQELTPTAVLNRSSTFCITNSNEVMNSSEDECRVDGSGAPTTNQPQYAITITRVSDYMDGSTKVGALFNLNITWEDVRGEGNDELSLRYGVYR
jgi:type II secretory pathway pseudopilin PulG